ncbi:MAG TPA: TIGR04076 family protein [Firmicutes bacterium]|nr:TIGR04076 family protein [Bacillota bacterium]
MYDLRVVVDHIKGSCDMPMHPGDYFEVRGSRIYIPDNKYMCLWALQSLMAILPAKQRDSSDPDDWLPAARYMSCPDPNGMVIFRIDRIERTSSESGVGANGPGIKIKPELCSGCRACELACSFSRAGVFDPGVARIRVDKDEPEGHDIPIVCRQCADAPCVNACPFGALHKDKTTGAILVTYEKCKGCRKCEAACPNRAVFFHRETKKVLICDLCGGDPKCVSRCVTGAITVREPSEKEGECR